MDSFSVLPDEILVHILSFLDTKGSVSTSILAKRWRFLWARVCHLSFASDDYRPVTRARLSSIVNRALLLHQGYNIEKFSLSHEELSGISDSELKTWVETLIASNVRELTLVLLCDVKLPRCLFINKTFVKLDLTSFYGYIPAVGVYLPALKILTLLGVRYESEKSLPRFLSGCPVLEELTIWAGFKLRCSISSPTIKKLCLGIGDGDAAAVDDDDRGMERYFSIGTLTSLAEVDIQIRCHRGLIGGDITYFQYVVKLLGKVCDVKCLTLYTSAALMMGVPDSAFSDWKMKFHNLTKLYVASDWRFATKFLEMAANLQDLTIRTGDANFILDWLEPDKVAACLVSRVEIVKFDWCGFLEDQEFEMIRYVLKNAMVLKRVTIHLHRQWKDKELEAVQVQKIRSFERGSKACEIAFEFEYDLLEK